MYSQIAYYFNHVVTTKNFQYVLTLLQEENAESSLLGTMLGLKEAVKVPDQLSAAEYLEKVLDKWGKQPAKCTWEVLREALKSCSYNALEAELEEDGRTGPSKIYTLSSNMTSHYMIV